MYISPRKDRDGNTYYSFSYIDDEGKRIRLKKTEHPHFTDKESAEAWAKTQDAWRASRKAAIDRKLAWKTAYNNFVDLTVGYEKFQKRKAPRSYKNNMMALEHYVLHYFLDVRQAGNINTWAYLYFDFRTWLDEVALDFNDRPIGSYSHKNTIIRTLNTFMTYCRHANKLDPSAHQKCPMFENHLIKGRDHDDVIEPEEFKAVHGKLLEIDQAAAEFYWILYHTGMRFNELFSLPMCWLFRSQAPDELHQELKSKGLKYYGYIYLESQGGLRHRRAKDGTVPRAPLKSRKTVSPEYARTIPIFELETWNMLAQRHVAATTSLGRNEFGSDQMNYMMFEDLPWNAWGDALRKANPGAGVDAKKTAHCCRHSYVTYMLAKTKSPYLIQAITGHTARTYERYQHIWGKIAQKAKQKEQKIHKVDESEGF